MLLCSIHTLGPDGTPSVCAAQLPAKDAVECFDLFLGPFDAGAHHRARETVLKAGNRILDEGEVHEGDLPDVEMEVALENALSVVGQMLAPLGSG